MNIIDGPLKEARSLLEYQVGENTLMGFLIAFLLFVGLFIVFQIFKRVVVKKFHKLALKTKNEIDDEIVKVVEGISPLFYLVLSLYFPLRMLIASPVVEKWISAVFIVVIVYQTIKIVQELINFALGKATKDGKREETAFHGLKIIVNILIWVIGILLVLSNLGFNITSLIAGLSIGGLAIAFAVQNILSDIFSSFSIYFDKPFKIGDFIVSGEHMGTVKKIGLKTTRLVALQGEEIVISNQELTNSRVQNFKKMKKRRIMFNIGLAYGTPLKKLKKTNEIIKKVIEKEKLAEFDRANFFEFGDFSLKFEVVFYVLSADYYDYMNVRENINFGIKEGFEKEKIKMAFPTQTVYIEK